MKNLDDKIYITKKNLSNQEYEEVLNKIDAPFFIVYNTCEDTFDITYIEENKLKI